MFEIVLQAAEDTYDASTLATIPGVVAVTLAVTQFVKAVLPINLSVGWLRLMAAVVAIGLTVLAAASGVSGNISAAVGTAAIVLAWIFVVVNGLVAATSAMGTFDLLKGQFKS